MDTKPHAHVTSKDYTALEHLAQALMKFIETQQDKGTKRQVVEPDSPMEMLIP